MIVLPRNFPFIKPMDPVTMVTYFKHGDEFGAK